MIYFLFFSSCSDEPVDMGMVLYERSGQHLTGDNFSPYFFFNQKVYNGPAFNKYRSGEKKEQGMLKNGFKPYDNEWWHFTLINEPFRKTYFNFPVE